VRAAARPEVPAPITITFICPPHSGIGTTGNIL
jgi:hypothetical protein